MNSTRDFQNLKLYVEDVLSSGDPVMLDCWTVKNSFIPLGITIAYLLLAKSLGPRIMKDREPHDLRKFMFFYDAVSIIANFVVVVKIMSLIIKCGVAALCREARGPEDEDVRQEAVNVVWVLYILKFVEMIDTVIFILRKKLSQISNLHVFHHSTVPVLVWITLRSENRMHMAIYGVLNCVVHIVMYSYYAISALGPDFRKFLKWKRYITLMQIFQFLMIIPYFIYVILSGCSTIKAPVILFTIHTTLLLLWFTKFYINNYRNMRFPDKKISATSEKGLVKKLS